MAVGTLIFAVLTALVAVNFIFAEENPLGPGDFDYDEVDERKHHKPPSKGNDTEKNDTGNNQEGTISLLFGPSGRKSASSSSNSTQNATTTYVLTCTKELSCRSSRRGVALRCHGTLRQEGSSSSNGSLCHSG